MFTQFSCIYPTKLRFVFFFRCCSLLNVITGIRMNGWHHAIFQCEWRNKSVVLFSLLWYFNFQARNKPADGSSRQAHGQHGQHPQRERTPSGQRSVSHGHHHKGSATTPTSNKPPFTSKSSSQSLNGKLSANAATATTKPPAARPGQKQKKKKQIYDVNVTIDLVS